MTTIPLAMDRPILHVNTENTWRGGENQVFQLAHGMHAGGCPTLVACRQASPLAQRLAAAEIPLATLRGDRGLGGVLQLRRIIRDHQPGLLHAHTSRAHHLCLLAACGLNLPMVVTRRVIFTFKRGPVARWKYGRRVTCFVAISQAIANILRAGGIPDERIEIIPSGIDFAPLDGADPVDLHAAFSLPPESTVVMNVAALTEEKDHLTLLQAWRLVEDADRGAHLIIVGDGALSTPLHTLRDDLRLARVRFAGRRDDVPHLLKSADIFVMSSHMEGLCTSIMDAKRCGLPVVATRAGGIPEVVRDGTDGLLVPVRDPAALARALLTYLREPGQRAQASTQALMDSQRFSAQAMVNAYLRLYQSLTVACPPAR